MIYFIQSGSDPFVKIGRSKYLRGRRSSLKTGNPQPLTILKAIPGGKKEEDELHLRFDRYNYHDEWFFLTKEVRDYIEGRKEHGSVIKYLIKRTVYEKGEMIDVHKLRTDYVQWCADNDLDGVSHAEFIAQMVLVKNKAYWKVHETRETVYFVNRKFAA